MNLVNSTRIEIEETRSAMMDQPDNFVETETDNEGAH